MKKAKCRWTLIGNINQEWRNRELLNRIITLIFTALRGNLKCNQLFRCLVYIDDRR